MKRYSIYLLLFLSCNCLVAQNNSEPLLNDFNNENLHDTVRLNAISNIVWAYMYFNPDSALIFAKKQLHFANEKKNKKHIGKALNAIGNAFTKKSNHPQAIKYFLQSLKIREEIGDTKGQASTLVNIGVLYMYLGDYEKAQEYYFKALNIAQAAGNKKEAALAHSNIAIIYHNQNNLDAALDYNFKALKIYEELGDEISIANAYMGIGKAYGSLSNFQKALDYFLKAQEVFQKNNNQWGHALSMASIGELYSKQNQSNKAIQEFQNALKIANELDDLDTQMGLNECLFKEYKISGKFPEALKHHEAYILLRDSLYNEKTKMKIIQKEIQFEYDKKTALERAEQIKKDEIIKEKNKRQQIILLSFAGGFLIVFVFAFVLYKRIQITKKQKFTIEQQKNVIEEHQREMLDSITYAKRIQQAILPSVQLIEKKLPGSFVLYKPKAIVAGDFYWMEEVGDTIFIAAADCTGHGVPGAMVSVVCSNALNRAVNEFNLTDTGKILDKTTDIVIETFQKSAENVSDGMDVSIMAFNKKNKAIQWSGANIDLWYFLNNVFHEIKADKQHIGINDKRKSFSTHTIEYNPGMRFYLYSDGYADQFGGPKGKKLREKQLLEIISSCVNEQPQQQLSLLNSSFEKWKGELEQVDDVCIVSILT